MPIMPHIQGEIGVFLSSALDFLLPRRCISCGAVNPDGRYRHICENCEKNLQIFKGGRCLVCAERVGADTDPDTLGCPNCARHRPKFSRSMASCSFERVARDIVIGLKYRNGAHLVSDISAIAAQTPNLEDFISGALLTPIPIHISRKTKRAYNQSELIIRALLKAFPKCECKTAKLLKRRSHSSSQTGFDREMRAENIADAFDLASNAVSKKQRILLVDDVMTTSATLSECAYVLRRAGFEHVDAYAFARRI